MTNPNNAVGTNAAYGARTSVNAFNDFAQLASGRGILSGWAVSPKSGMVLNVGGVSGTRDVAVAEDNLGNRTTINNRSSEPIEVEIGAASASSNRYDAIVVYVNSPAQASDTTPDAPGVCGIIAVQGGTTGVSEAQIRTAISADGGTGSIAYYAVLATIYVAAGTTTISSSNIKQSYISINSIDRIGSYSSAEVATPFTWIDGSTIYKKTFTIQTTSYVTTYDHGISNLAHVVNYEGWFSTDAGDQPFQRINPGYDDAWGAGLGDMNSSHIKIFLGTSYGNHGAGMTVYVTLYYTKTS